MSRFWSCSLTTYLWNTASRPDYDLIYAGVTLLTSLAWLLIHTGLCKLQNQGQLSIHAAWLVCLIPLHLLLFWGNTFCKPVGFQLAGIQYKHAVTGHAQGWASPTLIVGGTELLRPWGQGGGGRGGERTPPWAGAKAGGWGGESELLPAWGHGRGTERALPKGVKFKFLRSPCIVISQHSN